MSEQTKVPQAFLDYMERNYPPRTVISDIGWHAPKIWRAAMQPLTPPTPASAPVPALRSREEVLREYCGEFFDVPSKAETAMADRIRELEAPRGEAVVPERIAKALNSIAKAWPVLSEHASHIDGEFDNALRDVRRYIELHPPAASGVTEEHVSIAYTLPDTVQAIIDAAAAYEKKHGAWQDYRMSKRDDAFPVDKTERAIIVAYRQYLAALTASRGGG